MDYSREHKGHAHRFTLRTGTQVVSSVTDDGSEHRHELRGRLTGPPIPLGDKHIHEIMMNNIIIPSGPPIPHAEASRDMDAYGTGLGSARDLSKGNLPDLVDPGHSYVFKSGEFGLYDYWYIDQAHNYWKYTNAPEDSPEYNPDLGMPVLVKDQPTMTDTPQFFTAEGKKRSMAVPPDVIAEENEAYSPLDAKNIWVEKYDREGNVRYVYLDSDIRENVDLWVQYQLRITDANIPSLRNFAVEKFISNMPKDKIVGALLMLMDQGLYELEELTNASVLDIEFIDNTVKLLGRKFVCDPPLLDFLTSLVGDRDKAAPLFMILSIQGEDKVGVKHLASIFKYLKVSPTYLLCWNASYTYSRAMNRLAFEKLDPIEADGRALSDVKRAFATQKDMQYMIDAKLRETLLQKYGEAVMKSIVPRVDTDEYSTLMVFSDLQGRRQEEIEFSTWLHASPMHDITPEEQAIVEEEVARVSEELAAAEEESGVADQEAGAVDTDKTGDTGTTDAEGNVGTTDTEEEEKE